MNTVTKKLVSLIGPVVLKNILDQILNEEKLSSYRDNLVTFFRKTAAKTTNEIDDKLVEIAISTIMEPGKAVEQTVELCGILRAYVQDSQTPIDDILVLPILDRIEDLGTSKIEAAEAAG
ncbi:MAG: hypothetical protein ACK5M8_20335 [Shewanella algae]